MYNERVKLYKELENEFESKAIIYVTGDRPNMQAQIGADVIDYFIEHLDKIGTTDRISLYLFTRGGDASAAWNIINLLRMFCKELQVIVPHKAHSAGTIISLGANEIVMTKQATLSPIDPSVHTPLNPVLPGGMGYYAVSVEAVKGYLQFAQNELGIKDNTALANIYPKLTEYVHPLVIGQTYRTRAQIQMLAAKLLVNQVTEPTDIKRITDFLCSDSGGHDYTINRREAENDLKLKIRKPTERQYQIIKGIYNNLSDELQLGKTFNAADINGAYAVRRAFLESITGGSDYYITEGQIVHVRLADAPAGVNEAIQNNIFYDGWRHEEQHGLILESNNPDGSGNIYERTAEFQL